MRFHQIIAGACLYILSATGAQAAPSEAAVRWFDSFDQDKDGVLTPEEYTAVSEKQFGRVDSNGDGVVDQAEYIFGIPEGNDEEIERAKKRFAIMDRNGDGGATKEEYIDWLMTRFSRNTRIVDLVAAVVGSDAFRQLAPVDGAP